MELKSTIVKAFEHTAAKIKAPLQDMSIIVKYTNNKIKFFVLVNRKAASNNGKVSWSLHGLTGITATAGIPNFMAVKFMRTQLKSLGVELEDNIELLFTYERLVKLSEFGIRQEGKELEIKKIDYNGTVI
jgi:hypothetical protein